MKRLVVSKLLTAEPITHREIPIQIGLNFQTYENMLMNNGEIENSLYTPTYIFENPCDNMEWRLKDQNSCTKAHW